VATGRTDVDALAGSMTSPQLTEWLAYERLEPFAADRIDLNSAFDRWLDYRANGGKNGNPDEFRLRYGAAAKPESAAMKARRIKAGFAMLAATFKK
jgi:hypothetical protein